MNHQLKHPADEAVKSCQVESSEGPRQLPREEASARARGLSAAPTAWEKRAEEVLEGLPQARQGGKGYLAAPASSTEDSASLKNESRSSQT